MENFCCLKMMKSTEGNTIKTIDSIKGRYYGKNREGRATPLYHSKILRSYELKDLESQIVYSMSYCPWCGSKLPEDLGDTFFDIMMEMLGEDVDLLDIDTDTLPKEFQSDEWWKKRGL